MKLFKYSILALALAAGFSSCKDDDKYEPGAASDGVYFPTDDDLEVELDRDLTYFEVKVARLGETPAATYGLVGTADDEVFTLPTSVSFAEGASTATIKIDYVQANMGMDKPYDVTLAFAEGTQLSSYGYDRLEMAVTLPAPWTTIGKGTFADLWVLPAYYEIAPDYLTYEVELQQHDLDKTRYRFLHPYGEAFAKACAADGLELEEGEYDSKNAYNVEFICDENGNVLIPYQPTGVTLNADEGMIYFCNQAGMYYTLGGNDFETILKNMPDAFNLLTTEKAEDEDGKEYDKVTTIFQGPGIYRVGFEPNPDGLYQLNTDLGGYNWYAEGVEIKDYDITMKYLGVLNATDEESYVLADINIGEDLDKVVVGLVNTTDEEEAIAAVEEGTVDVKELNEAENPSVRFAFDGSSDYILAAVGYNEDGEKVTTAVISFFVADVSAPKEWSKLGTGAMIDGWVMPAFSYSDGSRVDPMDNAFKVDIEENVENPGIYRLVAPWTCEYYPLFKNNANQDTKYNLVIDARNPEFVTMQPQCTGFQLSNGKYVFAGNIGDYFVAKGYTEEEVITRGYNAILEDGVIEIVVPVVQLFAADATPGAADVAGSFYGEDEEECPSLIQLPTASASAVAKARINSTAAKLQARFNGGKMRSIASRFNMQHNHRVCTARLGKKVSVRF